MTDKLYHCKGCGKDVWRFSRKKKIKSFCETLGKHTWLRPAKTVKLRLTLPCDIIEFLTRGAEEAGVGPHEFFNAVIGKAAKLELEKQQLIAP